MKSTPRYGIIQKIIITLAVLTMSLVWPAGLFPVNQISSSSIEDNSLSNLSNGEFFLRQDFVPTFGQMNNIKVYLMNDIESFDTMNCVFRLYNTAGICLQETLFQLEEIALPGYVNIPIDVVTGEGTSYFYTIQGLDGDLLGAYCKEEQKAPELGTMYYKEVAASGLYLNTQFEYTKPMGGSRIVLAYAMIGIVTAGLLIGIGTLRNKLGISKWKKIEKTTKTIATTTVVALGIVSVGAIAIFKIFSEDLSNILVLSMGVIFMVGLIIWGIKSSPSEFDPLKEVEKNKKEKWFALIRGILWAGIIISCCRNNNSMTDYEKGLHLREMFTLICLLIVSYSKKKEIINLPNLIFTMIAIFMGIRYVGANFDHIEHINTSIRTSVACWGLGLAIINILYSLGNQRWKKLKQISISYCILVLAFLGVSVLFAGTREWPIQILLVFVLWNIKYILSDNKEIILEDICNGILLALVGTVIFCLYRRAYQYYVLMRYAGIYFTVTATAVYLCVPICAAFTKLSDIRTVSWKKRILELLLVGMSVSYMVFTISRTGIITLAVVAVFAIFFPFRNSSRKILGKQFRNAGVVVITCLLSIILFFSATRMIPALNGNPFYFFLENEWKYVTKDTPMNGAEYMTVQRFGEMVGNRLLGLDGFFETKEKETSSSVVPSGETETIEVVTPLSSTIEEVIPEEEKDIISDYSNGRMDIYKAYVKELKMSGHPEAGLTTEKETLVHAHNTYLQMAYDFGIPIGILFLIMCGVTFVRACLFAFDKGEKNKYTVLPLMIITAFGVASAFELVYLPSIPLGLLFIFMISPLMLKKSEWN